MSGQKIEKNYYETLGVSRYATRETIQEAYREVSRLYHPDSNFYDEIIDDPVRQEHLRYFQAATEAYKVLSNFERRQSYDQHLGAELEDWESSKRETTTRFAEKGEGKPVRPVLKKSKIWGKSTSMQERIHRYHTRERRRLVQFALAAPFVFFLVFCVVMTFVDF